MNSVEIAIKMELEAIKFYTEASNKVNSPAGKKMLLTWEEHSIVDGGTYWA